jgi:DNA-binding MarR family transcriptional regulator
MTDPILRLADFLPYRLSYTSNLVSGKIAQVYQSLFGLSIPEWRLIAVLAEQPGTTQQAIGSLTGMDKVTVSRAAVSLVERGLVGRAPNPDDKRSQFLSLTQTGQQLYAEVAPKAKEMEAAIFSALSPDEQFMLRHLLLRIDAAAS